MIETIPEPVNLVKAGEVELACSHVCEVLCGEQTKVNEQARESGVPAREDQPEAVDLGRAERLLRIAVVRSLTVPLPPYAERSGCQLPEVAYAGILPARVVTGAGVLLFVRRRKGQRA